MVGAGEWSFEWRKEEQLFVFQKWVLFDPGSYGLIVSWFWIDAKMY